MTEANAASPSGCYVHSAVSLIDAFSSNTYMITESLIYSLDDVNGVSMLLIVSYKF